MYFWSVSPADTQGIEAPFKVVDRKQGKAIAEELGETEGLAGTDPLGIHLMRALSFERNQCYGNAYYEYAAASAIDSSRSTNQLFAMFLVDKLGLTRSEAVAVLAR